MLLTAFFALLVGALIIAIYVGCEDADDYGDEYDLDSLPPNER